MMFSGAGPTPQRPRGGRLDPTPQTSADGVARIYNNNNVFSTLRLMADTRSDFT